MNNWHIILRNPYPLPAIGAAFAVFAVLMIWQYRAGARALSKRRRWSLILLHAAAAAVVAVVFLQPVLVSTNPVTEREVFVVLVDDSRSMNLPLSDGGSRMDAVNETAGRAVLGQLAGGVGHELRNPLGVMSNAVYYLKTILHEVVRPLFATGAA